MLRLPLASLASPASPASPAIPAETARVAQAIFPEGKRIMRIRDVLGTVLQTAAFAPLCPALGQPALDPAGLALVTVFECLEGLSDRQAADHVRRCIDGDPTSRNTSFCFCGLR